MQGQLPKDPNFFASAVVSGKTIKDKLRDVTAHFEAAFALAGQSPALSQFTTSPFDANTPMFINSFQGSGKVGGICMCLKGYLAPSALSMIATGGTVPHSAKDTFKVIHGLDFDQARGSRKT